MAKRHKGTYSSYSAMVSRCTNAKRNHAYYGVVSVYPKWLGPLGYDYFVDHVGKRPDGYSLDRIDNSKGYEPGNVRWVDTSTQQNNRRDTVKVLYQGVEYTKIELAKHLKIPYSTLLYRLKMGMLDGHHR